MRNLSKLALAALLAAGLAGTAVAAARPVHVMSVPLPDGTMARVQYAGDVAPRVTIMPVVPIAVPGGIPAGFAMPGFDMFAQMDREMAAAMRQIDELSRQPLAGGPASANLASYGRLPAGTTSYSSVTVSENGHQCSRSTEVIAQGAGKPPKISSRVSGDCGPPQQGAVQPGGQQGASPAAVPTGPIHQS
jgi:hypothetical protein